MYTLFILFFLSLIGIMVMVGRKLAPVRNGEFQEPEHAHPFVPDIQRMKHFSFQSFRKYEHLFLVAVVRLYLRFSNAVRHVYIQTRIKMKNMRNKKSGSGTEETIIVPNKFLSMISDYKHRIRHIKHKITEEEENK